MNNKITEKQKGFAPVIILVVAALSIILGGGIYYSRSKQQLKEKPTTVTPPQSVDQLVGWQEYINDRYHYKIKYPPDWYFLKEGYSPPPPTAIMLSNQKEGSNPGSPWVTFSIIVDEKLDRLTLPSIEETASLRAEGYDHKKINMAGEEAMYLFESQGDVQRSKAKYIYIIHKDYIYRIDWGGDSKELLDQNDEIFQKMLSSFTFTD